MTPACSHPPDEAPSLGCLPDEVLVQICAHLGYRDRLRNFAPVRTLVFCGVVLCCAAAVQSCWYCRACHDTFSFGRKSISGSAACQYCAITTQHQAALRRSAEKPRALWTHTIRASRSSGASSSRATLVPAPSQRSIRTATQSSCGGQRASTVAQRARTICVGGCGIQIGRQ